MASNIEIGLRRENATVCSHKGTELDETPVPRGTVGNGAELLGTELEGPVPRGTEEELGTAEELGPVPSGTDEEARELGEPPVLKMTEDEVGGAGGTKSSVVEELDAGMTGALELA